MPFTTYTFTDVKRGVILVDQAGGSLGFRVEVDDVGMDGPFVRVVTAATTSNTLLLVPDVSVRIER